MVVQVIELGATITSILVPDKHGKFDDVTTGFDTLAGEYWQCLASVSWQYRGSQLTEGNFLWDVDFGMLGGKFKGDGDLTIW